MKNRAKLMLAGIIGLLIFLNIGCFSVKGESKTLLPNQYWGLGKYLQTGDTLNFKITSSPIGINIYLMTDTQIELYQENPEDTASYYIKEWKSYLLVTYSFVALMDGNYWLLMINPSDSQQVGVSVQASIDIYIPPTPKTIIIDYPNNNDILTKGYHYIQWTTTGDIDYVIIELYRAGVFLKTLCYYEYNIGYFGWQIDINEFDYSSSYQILIIDYYDSSIYALSDSFTIDCKTQTTIIDQSKENIIASILSFVIPISIIISIIVLIIIIYNHRKRIPEKSIITENQVKDIPTQPKSITIPNNFINCIQCGAKITSNSLFCTSCGAKQ